MSALDEILCQTDWKANLPTSVKASTRLRSTVRQELTISSVLKTYIDVFESLEGSGEGVVLGSQFEPLGPQEIERLQRLQPCSTTQVEEKEGRQNKRAKLFTRYESLLSQFDASLSEICGASAFLPAPEAAPAPVSSKKAGAAIGAKKRKAEELTAKEAPTASAAPAQSQLLALPPAVPALLPARRKVAAVSSATPSTSSYHVTPEEILKALAHELQVLGVGIDLTAREALLKGMTVMSEEGSNRAANLLEAFSLHYLGEQNASTVANVSTVAIAGNSSSSTRVASNLASDYLKAWADWLAAFDASLLAARKDGLDKQRRRWEGLMSNSTNGANAPSNGKPKGLAASLAAVFNLQEVPVACDRVPNPFGVGGPDASSFAWLEQKEEDGQAIGTSSLPYRCFAHADGSFNLPGLLQALHTELVDAHAADWNFSEGDGEKRLWSIAADQLAVLLTRPSALDPHAQQEVSAFNHTVDRMLRLLANDLSALLVDRAKATASREEACVHRAMLLGAIIAQGIGHPDRFLINGQPSSSLIHDTYPAMYTALYPHTTSNALTSSNGGDGGNANSHSNKRALLNEGWGPVLIVTKLMDLEAMEAGLSTLLFAQGVQIMPYYGSDSDRISMRSYLRSLSLPSSSSSGAGGGLNSLGSGLYTERSHSHIVLTNYETLLLDAHFFKDLHWALIAYDSPCGLFQAPASPAIPAPTEASLGDAAQQLLTVLKSRHRILLSGPPAPAINSSSSMPAIGLDPYRISAVLLPWALGLLQGAKSATKGKGPGPSGAAADSSSGMPALLSADLAVPGLLLPAKDHMLGEHPLTGGNNQNKDPTTAAAVEVLELTPAARLLLAQLLAAVTVVCQPLDDLLLLDNSDSPDVGQALFQHLGSTAAEGEVECSQRWRSLSLELDPLLAQAVWMTSYSSSTMTVTQLALVPAVSSGKQAHAMRLVPSGTQFAALQSLCDNAGLCLSKVDVQHALSNPGSPYDVMDDELQQEVALVNMVMVGRTGTALPRLLTAGGAAPLQTDVDGGTSMFAGLSTSAAGRGAGAGRGGRGRGRGRGHAQSSNTSAASLFSMLPSAAGNQQHPQPLHGSDSMASFPASDQSVTGTVTSRAEAGGAGRGRGPGRGGPGRAGAGRGGMGAGIAMRTPVYDEDDEDALGLPLSMDNDEMEEEEEDSRDAAVMEVDESAADEDGDVVPGVQVTPTPAPVSASPAPAAVVGPSPMVLDEDSSDEDEEDSDDDEAEESATSKRRKGTPSAAAASGTVAICSNSTSGPRLPLPIEEECNRYVNRLKGGGPGSGGNVSGCWSASIIVAARARYLGVWRDEQQARNAFRAAYRDREGWLDKEQQASGAAPLTAAPMKLAKFKGKVSKLVKLSDGSFLHSAYYASLALAETGLLADLRSMLVSQLQRGAGDLLSAWVTTQAMPPAPAAFMLLSDDEQPITILLPGVCVALGRCPGSGLDQLLTSLDSCTQGGAGLVYRVYPSPSHLLGSGNAPEACSSSRFLSGQQQLAVAAMHLSAHASVAPLHALVGHDPLTQSFGLLAMAQDVWVDDKPCLPFVWVPLLDRSVVQLGNQRMLFALPVPSPAPAADVIVPSSSPYVLRKGLLSCVGAQLRMRDGLSGATSSEVQTWLQDCLAKEQATLNGVLPMDVVAAAASGSGGAAAGTAAGTGAGSARKRKPAGGAAAAPAPATGIAPVEGSAFAFITGGGTSGDPVDK